MISYTTTAVRGGNTNRGPSRFIAVAVLLVLLQSGHAYRAERPVPSRLQSLVGETMSSTNRVPFDWSSDYEVAVVYMTSMWPEFYTPEDSSLLDVIAKNGFLSYCVRFKIKLAAWSKSLQDDPDASEAVKNAASSWYRAIDTMSRNNWNLPEDSSLESFKNTFMTAYKHLVINGAEVYEQSDDEKTKRNVDELTRGIADILIETLRDVSNRFRSVPRKYDWVDDENLIAAYSIPPQ